jgi:hypothetical protein
MEDAGEKGMKTQLLDELARAIDAPRSPGRLANIKKAFAAYTESLKVPWWKRIWRKQNKETRPFWV